MADKKGRILEIIKRNLSEIIIYEMKNELTRYAIINEIVISKDYCYCKVYVSHIDENKNINLVNFLNKRKGHIRTLLSKRIDIYKTPELSFLIDETMINKRKIDNLLLEVKNEKMYTLQDLKRDQQKRKEYSLEKMQKEIKSLKDKKRALFNERITSRVLPCLGLKMQDIRKIANTYKHTDLSNMNLDSSLEENLIYFLISLSNIDTLKEQISFTLKNKEHLLSWYITDSISSSYHIGDINSDSRDLISLQIGNSYCKRLRYYIINRYLVKENVGRVLQLIIDDEDIVCKKAIAFLLEEAYFLNKEKVISFLKKKTVSEKTTSLFLRKVKESKKFTPEEKEDLVKKLIV